MSTINNGQTIFTIEKNIQTGIYLLFLLLFIILVYFQTGNCLQLIPRANNIYKRKDIQTGLGNCLQLIMAKQYLQKRYKINNTCRR